MGNSFFASFAAARRPATPAYGHVDVCHSGLGDGEAADLSAGRAVFLPWARPKAASYTNENGGYPDGKWRAAAPERYGTAVETKSEARILVVARHAAQLASLADWLRGAGKAVATGEDLEPALSGAMALPDAYAGLVVQIDGFGEIEDVVDRLIAFRRALPALPLILVSAGFRQDRPGAERLALCDVSLRDPVGLGQMAAVLEQAVQNNRLWQDRVQALSEDCAAPSRKITPRRVRPLRFVAGRA